MTEPLARAESFAKVRHGVAAICILPKGQPTTPDELHRTMTQDMFIIGTGFVIHESGVGLTAAHVLRVFADAKLREIARAISAFGRPM